MRLKDLENVLPRLVRLESIRGGGGTGGPTGENENPKPPPA